MSGLYPDSLGFLRAAESGFDTPMESYMNDRVNRRAIVVYLQVSTSRQDLRSQEPELQTWLQTNAGDRAVAMETGGR